MQFIRIPSERIAVLIGQNGSTRKLIEQRTKTKFSIEDTAVSIEGESFDEWIAKDVVKAIGRGFSPQKALKLLGEDFHLDVINIADINPSDKFISRMKARVIGQKGKCRNVIENLTNTHLSIYGKTISIIGGFSDVPVAREAIALLLDGARHAQVYAFLERAHKSR